MENKIEKKVYYVSLQNYLIKEHLSSFSNFKEWKVKLDSSQKDDLQDVLISKNTTKIYEYLLTVAYSDSERKSIETILNKSKKK